MAHIRRPFQEGGYHVDCSLNAFNEIYIGDDKDHCYTGNCGEK